MRVPGYWRTAGWVRSHFKSPNTPGVEQLALEPEVAIPRQREPAQAPARRRVRRPG